MSLFIGVLLLVFIYLGFLFPVGKLTITLIVVPVQIVYFSVFQYDQIPLTLSGFNNFQYSNGFNDLTSITEINQIFPNLVLKSTQIFENYNLTFFLLSLAPFTLSLISLIIVNFI